MLFAVLQTPDVIADVAYRVGYLCGIGLCTSPLWVAGIAWLVQRRARAGASASDG